MGPASHSCTDRQPRRPAGAADRALQHTDIAVGVDHRPRAATQRKLAEAIHTGPFLTAQRTQLRSMFGETAQPKSVREGATLEPGALQLRAGPVHALSVVQLEDGKKNGPPRRIDDYIRQGSRLLGSSIGILRPYIDTLETDLKFLAGVIKGGFHWSSLTQLLASINAKDSPEANPTLHGSIADYMQNVISNKKDYATILNELVTYREGRISELQGMRGELATCAQLINAGKHVRSMGQVHTITGEAVGSQEVDVTVEHDGKLYFVEVAASSSMLSKKLSEAGAQMRGYQALERSTANSRFAYSCPTLAMSQVSPELIGKLREARACLVVKGAFFEPNELEQETATLTTSVSDEKKVKRGKMSHAEYNSRKREQAKKSNRGYRRERLTDRGSTPTAKDLLSEELASYNQGSASDDEYSDDEYLDDGY